MKRALTAAVAAVALGLTAGTAAAQYPAVVPHRGHYHVVPTYAPPVVSGYGFPSYSPGLTLGGGYSSPGISVGGFYSSPGIGYGGGFSGRPSVYSGGYGFGGGGHHHHHHHHR